MAVILVVEMPSWKSLTTAWTLGPGRPPTRWLCLPCGPPPPPLLSPAATPRVPRQLRARPELEPTRHERPPAWTQALVPTWNGESCAAVRLGKSSSSIRNALSSNIMTFVHEEKTCIATLRCMVLLRVIGIAMSMFMRMFVIIYNACYTTFNAHPTVY